MDTPTKTTMGMMISALRKEQGMTQAELAAKMNVTDKAVSKWERDLSCPDVNALPRLAEIFDISVDELMQIKSSAAESPLPPSTTAREKLEQMISLILKALTVAMGVAVIVLSILESIDLYAGFKLLGLGLACAGISLLRQGR